MGGGHRPAAARPRCRCTRTCRPSRCSRRARATGTRRSTPACRGRSSPLPSASRTRSAPPRRTTSEGGDQRRDEHRARDERASGRRQARHGIWVKSILVLSGARRPSRTTRSVDESCAGGYATPVSSGRSRHPFGRGLEAGAEDRGDLLDQLGVGDERRGDLDDRFGAVVEPADQAAAPELLGEDVLEQPVGRRAVEARARLLVPDQLDRPEVPGAADVADDRDVAQRRSAQLDGNAARWRGRSRARPRARCLDRRQRDRRADRVAAEGEPVQVVAAPVEERARRPGRRSARPPIAKWAPVRPLAKVIMSGMQPKRSSAEPVADPAEGADHLVGEEQDPVPVADLAQALPSSPPGGTIEPPAFWTGSAIIIAIVSGALGRRSSPRSRPAARSLKRCLVVALGVAVGVGVRDVGRPAPPSGSNGARHSSIPVIASAPSDDAVVGVLAGDHLRAAPARRWPRATGRRQLPGRLDRLGPAGGEEGAVEAGRGELGEARGELDRRAGGRRSSCS